MARDGPALVVVDLDTTARLIQLTPTRKYPAWTFNGTVPGPLIRVRVGDTLQIR